MKTNWQNKPANFTRTVNSADGCSRSYQLDISVKFAEKTVDAKLKAGGMVVRFKNGKPKTTKIPVKATIIKIEGFVEYFHPAEKMKFTAKAKSCCKLQDRFDVTMGIKLALKHLFNRDNAGQFHEDGGCLDRDVRTAIVCELLPQFAKQAKV